MNGRAAVLSPRPLRGLQRRRGGSLVAYRWDGEPELDPGNFVASGG